MNDVSWGTRENVTPTTNEVNIKQDIPKTRMQKIMSYLSPQKEEEGSLDFSFGGLFRCMLCPHTKVKDDIVQLAHITNELDIINEKLTRINA